MEPEKTTLKHTSRDKDFNHIYQYTILVSYDESNRKTRKIQKQETQNQYPKKTVGYQAKKNKRSKKRSK
jgi:hypothetical protein